MPKAVCGETRGINEQKQHDQNGNPQAAHNAQIRNADGTGKSRSPRSPCRMAKEIKGALRRRKSNRAQVSAPLGHYISAPRDALQKRACRLLRARGQTQLYATERGSAPERKEKDTIHKRATGITRRFLLVALAAAVTAARLFSKLRATPRTPLARAHVAACISQKSRNTQNSHFV